MRITEAQTGVLLLESKFVYGAYPEFDNVARGWRVKGAAQNERSEGLQERR